ncbi:MAG: PEPxxWA-CTERM sorting domain-containing protein [Sphingorhabdus sp.]
MRRMLFYVAAAACIIAAPASAAEFIGDTTGAPTWNRPILGGPGLSNVGTAVPYKATSFTVDAAGNYVISLTALTNGFDIYLHLYQNSFDPNNPLTNLLAGDDDSGVALNSSLNFGLATGTSYFAVASGYMNDDFGAYRLAITGPGNVTIGGAVPEPATWAYMLLGFGLIGGALRMRKSRQSYTISYK